MTKLFAKVINDAALVIFAVGSILDVWYNFGYAAVSSKLIV